MDRRGKLIVLAILLLAAALAAANMIFQTRASGRAVAHWGSDPARLILTASQFEVLELGPSRSAAGGNTLETHSGRWSIVASRDAHNARGALHFRRALITDNLFDWDAAPAEPAAWRYALRFTEGESSLTLLLDETCLRCAAAETPDKVLALRAVDRRSPLQPFVLEQLPGNASEGNLR